MALRFQFANSGTGYMDTIEVKLKEANARSAKVIARSSAPDLWRTLLKDGSSPNSIEFPKLPSKWLPVEQAVAAAEFFLLNGRVPTLDEAQAFSQGPDLELD